ncbi:MAG: hypothetical protein HY088_00400, partial [Ignavibacteriales bacterium]|nr:hypothetical protein [Ignavibacteriales bacterium]
MLHLLTLSLILSLSHCSKSVDPDDMPRIDLTAENVGATEVWLRFTYNGFSDPRE